MKEVSAYVATTVPAQSFHLGLDVTFFCFLFFLFRFISDTADEINTVNVRADKGVATEAITDNDKDNGGEFVLHPVTRIVGRAVQGGFPNFFGRSMLQCNIF